MPRSDAPAGASPRSNGLRWWLILLSIAVFFFIVFGLLFGWAINMDTKYDLNLNADALVRQDAVGMRIFAWSGIALFVLMLVGGVIGGWVNFRRRRNRLSFGLSLLAAVPIFFSSAAFIYFILTAPKFATD